MFDSRTWQPDQSVPMYAWASYSFACAPTDTAQYACSPFGRLHTENIVLSNNAGDGASEWVVPEREIACILVKSFKEIPEVQSICAQFGPDGISIWTLLNEYNRDARQAVYERELALCEALGGCDFDFRVSSIDLINPQELVESGAREIFKR